MLCGVCDTTVADDDDRVRVRVDADATHILHARCFDKCSRNSPLSKLKPTQLCIYNAQFVLATDRVAGRRCCIAGCQVVDTEYVPVECSHAGCSIRHMHAACAAKKLDEVVHKLRKLRNSTQKDDTLRKTAFASKYDLVKSSCPCACGWGYFRILRETSMAARPERKMCKVISTSPPTTTRKSKHRPVGIGVHVVFGK